MNRIRLMAKIFISLLLFISIFVFGCNIHTPRPDKEDIISIAELKGPEWERYIGQTVTVDGIFVRDPIPMLVTDINVVLVNTRMPEDKYILLLGDMAYRINPDEYGGHKIRVIGQVNSAGGDNSSGNDSDEKKSKYAVIDNITKYTVLEHMANYSPKIADIHIYNDLNPDPRRWAILFSGGIDSAHNRIRYWNDLKFMYSTLVGTLKFSDKNIAVLYADGKALDKKMPVHYAATQTNLTTVFTRLREHSTDKDLIFFFTTNHGGGFNTSCPYKDSTTGKPICIYGGLWDSDGDEPGDFINEKTYNLDLNSDGDKKDTTAWDEVLNAWGGSIIDDALHTMVANIKFDKMIIVMEQCFSGGLIHDMAQGGDRIIISAAGEYEFSNGFSDQNLMPYDEFSYYFTSAINKKDPSGNKVDADTDKSKKVSLLEAFNYARSKDSQPETPWYEDSGDGIPHSGKMPGGSDGALGKKISLEP